MELLDQIASRFTPETISGLSRQIGADEATTQQAVQAALPVLVGALSRNANRSPQSAAALTEALEKDHDGSLLDQLGSLLGGGVAGGGLGGALGSVLGGGSQAGAGSVLGGLLGGSGRATNGSGILGHIFGNKRDGVEEGLSRASGLDRGKVMQLLVLLAPIVMSALGKVRRERGLGPKEVAETLRKEEQEMAQQTPGVSGGLLDFLDTDKDGSIADDVAKIGAALGGAVLAGKLTRRL